MHRMKNIGVSVVEWCRVLQYELDKVWEKWLGFMLFTRINYLLRTKKQMNSTSSEILSVCAVRLKTAVHCNIRLKKRLKVFVYFNRYRQNDI